MLLPPPVGASTRASPPPTTWRTTCSCWPRKPGKPNTRRSTAAGSSQASACTSVCSMRSAPADTDFHPSAFRRAQRELHRAMTLLLHALRIDAVRLQLIDHDLRAQFGQQDVGLPAAVVSAKPLTCATLPGCDFTHSAAWLITACAESSITADHSWKNTTNFCACGSAACTLPVAAHNSSNMRPRRCMADSLLARDRAVSCRSVKPASTAYACGLAGLAVLK